MPILFNSILSAAGIPVSETRLLRHKDTRAEKGRSPYELWRDDRPQFDIYQAGQSFGNANKLRGDYWASFIGTPARETIFVGLYRVRGVKILDRDLPKPHMEGIDPAGSCNFYDLKLDDRLSDFIGRLLIDWGDGYLSWIQRADLQDKRVVELRTEFKEPEFPGYLKFRKPLSELQALPVGWVSALKASRGVYLLTCPRTREQYVGSASGADGFWGRWLDYARTGHGDNIALQSRDPSDYQASILEVAGSQSSIEDLLRMEREWKDKLQSQEMGLNRN
jgi:hypothetical protein